VNTAPAEVLAALFPAVNQTTLEQFLESRVDTPAHGPTDLRERLEFDPRSAVDALTLIDVRSEFFAVQALATVSSVSQGLTVIVQRRAAAVIPISWQPALFPSMNEGAT
jgi:type II secretory pathway component PulK